MTKHFTVSPGGTAAGAFPEPGRVRSRGRVIRLSDKREGSVRFLTDIGVQVAEDTKQSWVTLTRTGTFTDPRYGEFSITSRMLAEMVNNFEAGAFGQDVFIDLEHDRKPGAAGRITRLNVEGNRLRALVEWTKFGVDAIRERGFRYLSAEFHEAFVDNETRQEHGTVLMGAGLTTRPVIKRLDPVELSEACYPAGARANLMHPALVRTLSQNLERNKMKWLEQLRKKLAALGLSEAVVKQLCTAAENAAKHVGEDEAALKALAASFESTGKSLADSIGDKEIKLSIDMPTPAKADEGKAAGSDGKTLSEEQIGGIVAKQLAAAQEKADKEAKQLAETLESRRKVFSDTINAAEGLNDAEKKELTEQAADLITGNMTDDQCKRLATFQISQANKVAAARKLAGMGFQTSRDGSPSISGPADGSQAKKLSDQVSEMLGRTSEAQIGRIKPNMKASPFALRVLAEFDKHHAARIDQEVKALAGETTLDGNSNIPVGFQRQVILEALSDLNVLNLLQTLTDFQAGTTMQIPYEERDGTTILNDGIVAEGAGIPTAGVTQKMDNAYVQAMKLAMKVTNEIMHFSVASGINWDAWARNLSTNTRIIRELLQRRVANNLQRAADAYAAVAVADEDIDPQIDGSTHTIKTANFPIVRAHQQKDIAGNNVGSAENALVVNIDGSPVTEYNGSGTQSAGTYYRVTNYNLGYIQFVDESGAAVTPSDPTTATVSYSYATNILKWDSDIPSGTTKAAHFDGLLQAVGKRRAVLESDRQVLPDFQLMSPSLLEDASDARTFSNEGARNDAELTAMGAASRFKGLAAFKTNAPGLDMGDERILIGQRGVGAYGIAKPWMVGQPFEAVDSNGLPTGQKVAYGEEYNTVHVPVAVRDRFTSVIVYSATARAAV